MPSPRTTPPAFELEQAEQHAGADAAGEKRQVGLRQVAFDEPDVRAGALDVVGRADDAQDVAALHDRPRLARHQLGAALQRFEVDAARPRVLRQRSERRAVHVGAGHDDGRRLHRHGRAARRRRSPVRCRARRLEERAAACGDHEPIAGLQRQRRIQLQQLAAPVAPAARTAVRRRNAILERRKGRGRRRGVLDAVRAQAVVGGGKRLRRPPAAESCCSSAFASR